MFAGGTGTGRRRRRHSPIVIENTDTLIDFGTQRLDLQADVSARFEFQVDGGIGGLEGWGGDGADDGFGNDSSKSLVETGELGRFETKTFIEADAPQRFGVGAAERHFVERAPNERGLGADFVEGARAVGNRGIAHVFWDLFPVVSDAAGEVK